MVRQNKGTKKQAIQSWVGVEKKTEGVDMGGVGGRGMDIFKISSGKFSKNQ